LPINDLLQESQKNFIPNYHGNRFSRDLKLYCSYKLLGCGRGSYKTDALNSSVPSISTVTREIRKLKAKNPLGIHFVSEISRVIAKRNYPQQITISTDLTRLEKHVTFNKTHRTLVGLTPPLIASSGLPDVNCFSVELPSDIVALILKHRPAPYLAVFMVRPMTLGAQPLCLIAYPTENRFKAQDCLKQFKTFVDEFRELGIVVDAIASDGDSKYLSAQKTLINYGVKPLPQFHGFTLLGNFQGEFGTAQDPPHLLNKLKLRVFDTTVNLWIGKFLASVSFLQILVKSRPPTLFGLRPSDVQNKNQMRDKMDKESTYRLCNHNVISLLIEKVDGSHGTAIFLQMMTYLKEALINPETSLNDRLHKLVFVVSFLRRWRQDLLDKKRKLTECFITENAYNGIEMNLILFIRLLVVGRGQLIILCNSQTCEHFFGYSRCESVKGSKKTNFDAKDFHQILERLQTSMFIAQELKDKIKFSESLLSQEKDIRFQEEFLTDEEIDAEIEEACNQAKLYALKCGITSEECLTVRESKSFENAINENKKSRRPASDCFPKLRVQRSILNDVPILTVNGIHYINTPLSSSIRILKDPENTNDVIEITIDKFIEGIYQKERERVTTDRRNRFIVHVESDEESDDGEEDLELFQRKQYIKIGDWILIDINLNRAVIIGQVVNLWRFLPSAARRNRIINGDRIPTERENNLDFEITLEPKVVFNYQTQHYSSLSNQDLYLASQYKVTVSKKILDPENRPVLNSLETLN
jgi:hypothetical protein